MWRIGTILLLPLGSSSLWDNLLAVNVVEAVVAGTDLPPAEKGLVVYQTVPANQIPSLNAQRERIEIVLVIHASGGYSPSWHE